MNESFQGGVLPAGESRQAAELRLSISGIEATTAAGTHTLPWSAVRSIERGGSSGATIFLRGSKLAFDCDHPDFLRAVEGTGGNDIADQLARLAGQKVATSVGHGVKWALFLALLGLLFWGVPKGFRAGVDGVVESLPYSVDEAIGEAASTGMDTSGEVVEDPVVVEAIQGMLDRLAPHADMPDLELHLTVVDNEIANAFALPGGYITVFTGLIEEAESPEMVAGVLAHEIAHVTRRHGLRRVAHSLGLFVGLQLLLGDTSGLAAAALEVFTLAKVNGYSREQESQADADAVRLMEAAGLDPRALAGFFEHLEEEHGSQPPALTWISTHPEHRDRIDSIEALATPGMEYSPLDVDWEAVQAALAE